ncbi:MAG: adenylate cyclase [Cyclobacteriaceae bacterium]|nr:MAG: adenylate cyclase [Cyclobacteriaceae bacterium]
MNRQLAAILFSDIVGYTSMMRKNESATLELVRKSREIQQQLVAKHQGKWLKEMGDGAMAQFNSALDAVNCGIEIQQAVSGLPETKLRIGIHLGDITVENDEVYGDGVNVASRIESIAEPGSVFISEAVQGAIKGSNIHTSFQGEKRLKNVDHPVRVYKIVDQEESVTISRVLVPLKSHLPWMAGLFLIAVALLIWKFNQPQVSLQGKTIAVLPLKMSNPDSTNQYLVQGITEELVRSIGKLKVLTVVNPLSTMRFAASLAPVNEASVSLENSDLFLSGTFEINNNQLQLDLSLYDRAETVIWSRSYSGDVYELPSLAGSIAVDLAEFVHLNLSESETARIVEIPPVDPESFQLMLLGKNHLEKFTAEDVAIGLNYLRQAVNNNPTSSRAWSNLAEGLVTMGHSPMYPPGVWEEARAAATRALQLDSLNAEAWAWLGTTKTYYHWDYDGAVYCYNKANALNPNLPMSHYHYSWHLALFDSLDKAVEEHEIAFKLDPLDPFQAARLGHIYLWAGDMNKAMMELRRSQKLMPDFLISNLVLGEYYMTNQEYDSAEFYLAQIGVFGKGRLAATYLASGKRQEAMDIIQEMKTNIMPYYAVSLAMVYSLLNDADQFFEYANYPQPHAFHPWLRVMVKNPEIISDPRFEVLMDKMNLPMPVVQ